MRHFLAILFTQKVREIISATALTHAEIQAQKESIAALYQVDPAVVNVVEERRGKESHDKTTV